MLLGEALWKIVPVHTKVQRREGEGGRKKGDNNVGMAIIIALEDC
jgi:hypothetical protein